MRFRILLAFLFCCSFFASQAQERIYQISGLVLSQTNDSAISYVRVRVNHSRHGALSNADGFFSIAVRMSDTLYFSRLGYHTNKLVVKEYVESYQTGSQYIYVINYMLEDIYTLPAVTIFPYNTPEELRTAVVNMEIARNTPGQVAESHLKPEVLLAIAENLYVDEGERALIGSRMYQDYYLSRNVMPTVGLNPIAIAQLLQQVAKKASERKNKDLNYWE